MEAREPYISEDEMLLKAVRRLQGNVLGLVLGFLLGGGIWVATLWLVIKGGQKVGQHLKLLGQYFIGYTVTIPGSFVGLVYGFVCGYLVGWIVAWIYNRVVSVRSK